MAETYLIKFYYIGKKKYFGSQRQIDKHSIEECLIDALTKKKYIIDNRTSRFRMASRTDRCVSARGAAFSFIPTKKPILMEINTALPPEMGVWASSKVSSNFSPRFDAIIRHYKYIFPVPYNQLVENFNFDLEILRKACKDLEGRHDFKNFSKININESINTVRDLERVETSLIGKTLFFDFIGRSFLRQQIRRTIRVLMNIGLGNVSYNDLSLYFDPKNKFDIEPVGAQGLILWDIKFGKGIEFEVDEKSMKRMNHFFLSQMRKLHYKKQIYMTMLQKIDA